MRPRMVRKQLTLALSSGTGWATARPLPALGRQGRILAVLARKDDTNNAATAIEVWIADAALSATPDDLVVFYASGSVDVSGSGSDTDASLRDALAVPAPYAVDAVGDVRVNLKVTAGSGATDVYITVYAEVWG